MITSESRILFFLITSAKSGTFVKTTGRECATFAWCMRKTTFQRHTKCGSHCLRRKKNNLKCRYNFPHDLQDKSSIDDTDSYYKYSPIRNDPYMQKFNNIITQIWRANPDFTPTIDLQSILRYIVKYTTKSEVPSTNYLNTLEDFFKKSNNNTSAKQL